MSSSPGRREVAHRLFATEYDDASLEYAESDEERAPNYVVTPTGARINRLFLVGVLTSVEQVNEDTVRARVADPTGAFVVYAGQYQPDELAALQSIEAPAFVAVTGKANTFSPEGSDRVLTSVRPESVTEVDAETRDRWVVTAAEHTLGRVETVADALGREERGEDLAAVLQGDGVEPGLAEGVSKAIDHYGPTADYLGALREAALQAVEVVAGERAEAEAPDLAPADGTGEYAFGDLTDSAPEAAAAVTDVAGEPTDVPEPSQDDAASDDVASDAAVNDATADDAAADRAAEASTTADAASDATSTAPDTDDETGASEPATAETAAEPEQPESETDSAASAAPSDEPPEPTTESDADDGGVGSSLGDAPEPNEALEADDATDAGTASDEESAAAEDVESDELYEVDEEERERIEEEYGVGFESGTEVGEPGEADIDVPAEEDADPGAAEATEATVDEDDDAVTEEAAETGAAADAADSAQSDAVDADGDGADADEDGADADGDGTDADEDGADADGDGTDADEDGADEEADAEDVDIDDVLLTQMEELDDGDGAERDALIDAVVDETGASEADVEDAIEDALMSGQCYEPSEATYKPI